MPHSFRDTVSKADSSSVTSFSIWRRRGMIIYPDDGLFAYPKHADACESTNPSVAADSPQSNFWHKSEKNENFQKESCYFLERIFSQFENIFFIGKLLFLFNMITM